MSTDESEKKLYAGVDVGGTRTRVFLLDPDNHRCALGESLGCNPVHSDEETIRQMQRDALSQAFTAWQACYGTPADTSEIVSVFIAAAGFLGDSGRQRMRRCCSFPKLAGAKLDVDMEMRVALFAGLEGRPGISLIVGTGTACFAKNADGYFWQSGGWENLVSDEGGGYWLGLQGISTAVKMADGRLEETGLKAVIFKELGIKKVGEIITRLHSPPITKAEIAKLAVVVLREAEQGDPGAREIASQGSLHLAAMVDACHRKLKFQSPEISITGGSMRSDYYRNMVISAIQRQVPTARVIFPALPPVIGAVLLALEQDGRRADDSLLQFLKEECAKRSL